MKKSVIYIYPHKSSFIRNDIAFLKDTYIVKEQELKWNNAFLLPVNFIKQFLFLLKHIKSTKIIIISFAGYFSLLPVLLGKMFNVKILIILNGTECVSFPTYNYGSLRKKILKNIIKLSLDKATKLLPVDKTLISQTHQFDDSVKVKNQGYLNFFPNNKTSKKVIPNGFDIEFWNYNPNEHKEGFITVASIYNSKVLKLKGIDLIIDLALKNPDQSFTIVGVSEELKRSNSFPKNVRVISFLNKEDLKEEYQKHQFYLQLSINEGFGCALAEAMLCGCVPIVSNAGALPNVIGNTGYIVNKRDVDTVNNSIHESLLIDSETLTTKTKLARERIVENFPISKREHLFLQEIEAS